MGDWIPGSELTGQKSQAELETMALRVADEVGGGAKGIIYALVLLAHALEAK